MPAFMTLDGLDDLHLVCHTAAGHKGKHRQVSAAGDVIEWSMSGPEASGEGGIDGPSL
ncbi:hypothetical protein [Nocardia suismassiliense]|uniref:hypothetical protein n=1 Tax=Nocardia suismassiliense TaxID=2077092 RepID=UPI00131F2432|nr:hypothetical protein [Nocardia suismassiliense]